MTTIPRNRTHLAQLLNISKGMVSRLAARGMPVDTLEAATSWRKANLDQARRKDVRFDPYRQVQTRSTPLADEPHVLGAVVAHAEKLLDLAAAALGAGLNIGSLVPGLRAALAAVPPSGRRDGIGLPLAVAAVLCADVVAVLPRREDNPLNDDGTPVYCTRSEMSDEDAQYMGRFWYQVCAGEIRVTAP